MSSGNPYSARRSISCTAARARISAHSGYGSRTPLMAWASSKASNGSRSPGAALSMSVLTASLTCSRRPSYSCSSQLLTQHELLHLAGRGPREVVDDAHVLRPLDPCQPRARQMGTHALETHTRSRCLRPGQHPHERARVLAHALVGRGHDRRLGHTRHVQQLLLDLRGADVLAAPDDDVLLAVGDREVPVVVDDPDVARDIPAVVDEC